MKQASNITPFYNRVGFYDRNVTDNSQNILMKQVANTQFRNIVTDIVPIKNGGAVKINPANLTPGLNYLALSFGKQYGGVPSMTPEGVNPTLDEQLWRAQHTYLRELLVKLQEVKHRLLQQLLIIPKFLLTQSPHLNPIFIHRKSRKPRNP